MAFLNLELIDGNFCFAENPVVVKAHTFGFDNDSIFRQVIFRVDTNFENLNSQHRQFEFSVNADGYNEGGNEDIRCDISSALRASLAKYVYDASIAEEGSVVEYPISRFTVSVFTRAMIGGEIKESGITTSDAFYAYLGGLSEHECWISDTGINCSPIPLFSTKPEGETFGQAQLKSITTFDTEKKRVKSVFSVHDGLFDARDRATILFVNSRGVYETISVMAAESEEYEIDSEVRSLVGSTAYRPSSSVISYKEGGGAVWKMSSGYVNREWVQWFAREFLMAKNYWLRKDGRWLPVAITTDNDSVTTYDKSEPSLISVNFTVRSAING